MSMSLNRVFKRVALENHDPKVSLGPGMYVCHGFYYDLVEKIQPPNVFCILNHTLTHHTRKPHSHWRSTVTQ
jgi:hypothetical protein